MSDVDKKQTAKKSGVKEAEQKQGSLVYIGPDIPGAKQYTVFNNGLPDVLKEKIKKYPFFNSLVIPVERLAKANAELAKRGSALSTLFQKARGK